MVTCTYHYMYRVLKLVLVSRYIREDKKYWGGGGTPYIWMIGMIVVSFRGCNRRFGIF